MDGVPMPHNPASAAALCIPSGGSSSDLPFKYRGEQTWTSLKHVSIMIGLDYLPSFMHAVGLSLGTMERPSFIKEMGDPALAIFVLASQ